MSRASKWGDREVDVYVLAAPPDTAKFEVQKLVLRDIATGKEIDVDPPTAPVDTHPVSIFRRMITVRPFGEFRRVPTTLVRVDRTGQIAWNGRNCEVAAYTIRIPFAAASAARKVDDSAFASGIYRKLIDTVVANPADVSRFATASEKSGFPGPTEWQPTPESSPGFAWLKIPVKEEALYAIDAKWLTAAGVDPNCVKPESLALWQDGKRVPSKLVGPEGAGFAGGERRIFYGAPETSDETATRFYYLGAHESGAIGPGLDFPGVDGAGPSDGRYARTLRVQKDEIFQTRLGNFLSVREMTWVWVELVPGKKWKTDFDLPGFIPSTDDATTTAALNLYWSDHVNTGTAKLEIALGDEVIATSDISAGKPVVPLVIPLKKLQQGLNHLSLTLIENSPAGGGVPATKSGIYFDSADFAYTSRFVSEEGMHLAEIGGENGGHLAASGFRKDHLIAMDVTDALRPLAAGVSEVGRDTMVTLQNAGGRRRILFIDDGYIRPAPAAEKSHWANAGRRDQSADLVIIYHPIFEEAAKALADDLRKSGQEVLLADSESIYESFSYGKLSTEAIRNYLAVAVHEWTGRRPAAVIVIGDSNSDGRDVARNGVPDYLPIHQVRSPDQQQDSVASDQFYAWLNPGDEESDLIVGRISSSTPEEAMATVHNIAAYRAAQDESAEWKDLLVAVADTGEFRDSLDKTSRKSIRDGAPYKLLAADDFGWEDNYYLPESMLSHAQDAKVCPLLTAAIEQSFNEGAGVVAFMGHGAPNLWSNQRFWFGGGTPNSDIIRLKNAGKLPYVASFTCNNAVVDYPLKPWNICIAEDFMRHEGQGAVSCFMPSGPGYVPNHELLAGGFLRAWSVLGVREHGLMAELARINHQARDENDDHSRMFLFLGDPTLRMAPPNGNEQKVKIDRAPLPYRIVSVDDGGTTNTSTLRRWNVVLDNPNSETAQSRQLTCDIMDESGAVVESVTETITVPESSRKRVMLEKEIKAVGAGAFTVRFSISDSDAPSITRSFAIAHNGGGLTLAAPIAVKEGNGRDTRRIEATLANAGLRELTPRIEIFVGDEKTPREIQNIPAMKAGAVTSVATQFPTADGVTTVRIHAVDETGERDWLQQIDSAMLSDLHIVEGSVTAEPSLLSEGETIFVNAQVENVGVAISPRFYVRLYKSDDVGNLNPMRDMTPGDHGHCEPLAPGAKRTVRLRWDPYQNSGDQNLRVVADPDHFIPEVREDNNEQALSIHVRTKSKLKPGELKIGRGKTPGTYVFLAEVANSGETDSHHVTVNFYLSQTQNADTKIGEGLIDHVPANGSAAATFEWSPRREDVERADFAPSFTLALKGSQQRVSSVAATP